MDVRGMPRDQAADPRSTLCHVTAIVSAQQRTTQNRTKQNKTKQNNERITPHSRYTRSHLSISHACACAAGFLGRLVIKIPWANLRGKAVKIELHDLYILAGPPSQGTYSAQEEADALRTAKYQRLAVLNALEAKVCDRPCVCVCMSVCMSVCARWNETRH